MASNPSSFSRTLSLLRRERGVSQRIAAEALGISQALLSHYENGVREPGLAFVVKACDYYGVSADFILGRTLSREGGMLSPDEILNAEEPGKVLRGSVLALLQEKLLSGSIGVLFGLLGKQGDKDVINAAAAFLGSGVYRLYRHLYRAAGRDEKLFSLAPEKLNAAAADQVLEELQFVRCLRAQTSFPEMSPEALNAAYPGQNQGLTHLLSTTDARLARLSEDPL